MKNPDRLPKGWEIEVDASSLPKGRMLSHAMAHLRHYAFSWHCNKEKTAYYFWLSDRFDYVLKALEETHDVCRKEHRKFLPVRISKIKDHPYCGAC